jgi:hypothetical protein
MNKVDIINVVETLINDSNLRRAVKYISPKMIVRGTRGKIFYKTDNIEITLTIGRPNYIEREFIKLCQKAKEPFPIKKIQLQNWPKKKKNPKKS